MTRLPDIDHHDLSPEIGQILDALPDLGLFRLLAHAKTVMPSWLMMGGTLLSELSLPPELRELAILQVAATSQCDYERIQHVAIASGVGLPSDQIDAVVHQQLDADCLAEHSEMLRAIDRLVRTQTLDASGFAGLRESLDDQQTVELLIVVGWYLAIALMAGAVDLTPDSAADMAVVEAAGTHLGATS